MIQLNITCSHCGKSLQDENGDCLINADELSDINRNMIADRVRELGWIAEENGNHLDTYCSARCAK